MQTLRNASLFRQGVYLNGSFVNRAANGGAIPVVNPSTGALIGNVPNVDDAATIDKTISDAHEAFQLWKKLLPRERSAILRRWNDVILANKEDLAIILSTEGGKPLVEARGEIDYGASFLTWFAEEGIRAYGDVVPPDVHGRRILVSREPVGVCGAITPWNFPNAMITRKVAPALAAGCTVVVKPSEYTPFSALALAELAQQAGMPKGVFNVVTGPADVIGKALCASKTVKKIGFTGSTAVGKILYAQCAPTVKKISLELGGNAPFIVFDDCNLDLAVDKLIASKFRNGGQTCVSTNRVYLHEPIQAEFVRRLMGKIATVPRQSLINSRGADKVESHIRDAVAHGGKVLVGGSRHPHNAIDPTIIANCNDSMLVCKEETFGPIVALFTFETEAEVVAKANAVDAGLAAYMFTKDLSRAFRVSEALEYGMVGINEGLMGTTVAPFGGVKESGIDREGSRYGILPYLDIKYRCLNLA